MHYYTLVIIQYDQSGMIIIRPISEKSNFPFLIKHEWKTVRVQEYSKYLEMNEYISYINNEIIAHSLYTSNSEDALLCFL